MVTSFVSISKFFSPFCLFAAQTGWCPGTQRTIFWRRHCPYLSYYMYKTYSASFSCLTRLLFRSCDSSFSLFESFSCLTIPLFFSLASSFSPSASFSSLTRPLCFPSASSFSLFASFSCLTRLLLFFSASSFCLFASSAACLYPSLSRCNLENANSYSKS